MPALLTGQFPLQSDREGSPGRREWVEAHRLLSNIAQENHSHMTLYSSKYFSILPKTCLLLWPSVWNKLLLPKSIFLGEAGTCIQFDMCVITAILTIDVMALWFSVLFIMYPQHSQFSSSWEPPPSLHVFIVSIHMVNKGKNVPMQSNYQAKCLLSANTWLNTYETNMIKAASGFPPATSSQRTDSCWSETGEIWGEVYCLFYVVRMLVKERSKSECEYILWRCEPYYLIGDDRCRWK